MTTTAEVRQLVERYAVEAERVVFCPSGLLASDEGIDRLARDIVALANHEGGRVILGVSESGQFEGRIELDREAMAAAVDTLSSERVVPTPELALETLAGDEGELAVIRVERRSGAPHAVARRLANDGVGARAYYVRDGARTRSVGDERLAWMFRVVGDPAVRADLAIDLHLTEGGMEIDPSVPQPVGVDRFRPLLASVAGSMEAGSDLEARARGLNELAGWAFVAELRDACEATGLPMEEVRLDDLPVPERASVFGADGRGLRALLDGDRRRGGLAGLLGRKGPGRAFSLPVGSDLQVDFLGHQGKGRVTLVHPAIVATFSSLVADYGAGTGPSLGGRAGGGREWVRLQLALNVSLRWHPREGAAVESMARELVERVHAGWDSDRWTRGLDPVWRQGL